jgi:hypothetical protein
VRAAFAERHPGYEIVGSEAVEGSPESVRCQVSYRKPEAEQIYRDIWMYQRAKDGWSFSKILKTGEKEPTP